MKKEDYNKMQQNQYDVDASRWSLNNLDPVVGSFMKHNNWRDYEEYLFLDCKEKLGGSCIDFACGPGRNIEKFNDLFQEFDGVDISQVNLDNAVTWLKHNGRDLDKTVLYKCNGMDLSNINSDKYDVVMSTIALQHICVHEIRYKYFEDFFRILKSDGCFTAQMGYGYKHPQSVGYYENYYEALGTNGLMDVRVENENQLKKDLYKIGFTDFRSYIRPVGPGDRHDAWIFFSVRKP